MRYYAVKGTYVTPAEHALATRYQRLGDAMADMGHGLIYGSDGHLAAFHETQLRWMQAVDARLSA